MSMHFHSSHNIWLGPVIVGPRGIVQNNAQALRNEAQLTGLIAECYVLLLFLSS